MANEVRHNPDKQRYEIFVDGTFAGHVDANDNGEAVAMPHTIVLDEFGGRGLAAELVTFALDDLRKQGRSVLPQCPYVKRFIEKNPEYADMVAN